MSTTQQQLRFKLYQKTIDEVREGLELVHNKHKKSVKNKKIDFYLHLSKLYQKEHIINLPDIQDCIDSNHAKSLHFQLVQLKAQILAHVTPYLYDMESCTMYERKSDKSRRMVNRCMETLFIRYRLNERLKEYNQLPNASCGTCNSQNNDILESYLRCLCQIGYAKGMEQIETDEDGKLSVTEVKYKSLKDFKKRNTGVGWADFLDVMKMAESTKLNPLKTVGKK